MRVHVLVMAAILAVHALPAGAVDTQEEAAPQPGNVDLTAVRAKVKAKDWAGAIADLVVITNKTAHADAYNLLAFSLRNVGSFDEAHRNYDKALALDPDHKGAREYLGELYVKTGQMAKAREQLAILRKLCPTGCEELDDLNKAIAAGPPPAKAKGK